jgi:hypothetical protein
MSGCQIERLLPITGHYEVDSREVAEAIVRSWVLVAGEPGHGSVRAEEDEPASR